MIDSQVAGCCSLCGREAGALLLLGKGLGVALCWLPQGNRLCLPRGSRGQEVRGQGCATLLGNEATLVAKPRQGILARRGARPNAWLLWASAVLHLTQKVRSPLASPTWSIGTVRFNQDGLGYAASTPPNVRGFRGRRSLSGSYYTRHGSVAAARGVWECSCHHRQHHVISHSANGKRESALERAAPQPSAWPGRHTVLVFPSHWPKPGPRLHSPMTASTAPPYTPRFLSSGRENTSSGIKGGSSTTY